MTAAMSAMPAAASTRSPSWKEAAWATVSPLRADSTSSISASGAQRRTQRSAQVALSCSTSRRWPKETPSTRSRWRKAERSRSRKAERAVFTFRFSRRSRGRSWAVRSRYFSSFRSLSWR